MTIDLDSGSGLFDRLGKLIKLAQQTHTNAGGSGGNDIPVLIDGYVDKFSAGTNGERATFEGIQSTLAEFQSSTGQFCSQLQRYAEQLVIEMANADDPLPALDVNEAIGLLVRQMDSGSETINASEPTSVISYAASNDGDGIAIVSLADPLGATSERVLPEDILIRFESSGSAIAVGQHGGQSTMSFDYPTGSGSEASIQVIDAAQDGFLDNPGFETWTDPSTPGSWVVTGTVAEESSIKRSGSKSLKVASGTPTLEQAVTGAVAGQTPYVLHLSVRSASGVPATGQITLSITDGTSVINDEQGNAQQFVVNAADVSTTWKSFASIMQLVDPLPATVELKIDVNTGFPEAIYLDDCSFGVSPEEQYPGGPYLALIQGQIAFGLDDLITVAVSNANASTFQSWFGRLFPGTTRLLPSATGGAETIPDSLIG